MQGSAVNQDGRSSSLTAPNGISQQALISTTLQAAGLAPGSITCLAVHGTGTPLGDPIGEHIASVASARTLVQHTSYMFGGQVPKHIPPLPPSAPPILVFEQAQSPYLIPAFLSQEMYSVLNAGSASSTA